MTKVMVFGVFDGLHAGHRALFAEARQCGDHLIAVVTPDTIVKMLKGHAPKYNLSERFAHLEAEDGVSEVATGDERLGEWGVIKKYQPDIIVLGYDQNILKDELEQYIKNNNLKIELKVASSFEPNKYHSSLINK